MLDEKDYIMIDGTGQREVRQYSFVLNNSKLPDKKIATHLTLNASTELHLWLNKDGNVIGLDFVQVKESE